MYFPSHFTNQNRTYCFFFCLSTNLHSLNLSTAADTVNTTPNKNFIGLLNEHCQRSKQVANFKAVGRKGPAHDPE